ncbi:hypothetical protein OG444_29965 [Streptomyces sp. NBC_01232]|nr:hypothetical protein OG444_29965 [Streptomyces sp. NBC_01232]
MIDDDAQEGFGAHVTRLDTDRPGLWPGERPTADAGLDRQDT